MVELTSYIKGVASMMEKVDTLVADSVWESIHSQVQEFVQNRLSGIQKSSFRKKKDLARYDLIARSLFSKNVYFSQCCYSVIWFI
jgi:hypothetical protein